jgi:transposase
MDASPPPKSIQRCTKKPGSNMPEFDLHTRLYRMSGVDFTQISGLGTLNVPIILSEVGLDPSRLRSAKHFSSWLGLCPDSRITGGKVKCSKTQPWSLGPLTPYGRWLKSSREVNLQ